MCLVLLEMPLKAPEDLLSKLRSISKQLTALSSGPGEHDLDPDAIVDLTLARDSVDKLIRRVEHLKP